MSAAEALAWAPVMLRHGAWAGAVYGLTLFGTHTGEESHVYERLRKEFEAVQPSPEPMVAEVRAAAIADFANREQIALASEREERVTGNPG